MIDQPAVKSFLLLWDQNFWFNWAPSGFSCISSCACASLRRSSLCLSYSLSRASYRWQKGSPEPSVLKTEQTQFRQPLLLQPGHWCPAHPSGPPLGSPHVHVFVVLSSLKLSVLHQVQSHKGKWRQTFWLAQTESILAHTVQLAFFAAKGHCSKIFIQHIVHQDAPVLFCQVFPHAWAPALIAAWSYSLTDRGLCICLSPREVPVSAISSACPGPSELQPVLLHIVWYYLQRGWVSSGVNKDWTVSAWLKSRCTTPFVPPWSMELVSGIGWAWFSLARFPSPSCFSRDQQWHPRGFAP